jgi:hypothetical protein
MMVGPPVPAWTQADIDALKARINQFAGIRQTSFADQSTEFDLEGALKLLAEMEQQVNGSRTRYAATSKGT